jgi:hypothetical protein
MNQTKDVLTLDQVREKCELKAAELSLKFGCTVTPLIFKASEESEDIIIGYIKEPSRLVKLRVMDKALGSVMTASAELLDSIIISEESDPRITVDLPENDIFYIGAAKAAYDTVKMAVNQFAKK